MRTADFSLFAPSQLYTFNTEEYINHLIDIFSIAEMYVDKKKLA